MVSAFSNLVTNLKCVVEFELTLGSVLYVILNVVALHKMIIFKFYGVQIYKARIGKDSRKNMAYRFAGLVKHAVEFNSKAPAVASYLYATIWPYDHLLIC
ncbi:hypothetical protein ACFE04_007090 [Oxalis oulophora]